MRKIVSNLKYIFEPKSIAVVGASQTANKIGNVVIKNLVAGHFGGQVYAVNPKYNEVLGKPCFQKVSDIPGSVDCIIIATPAKSIPLILEDAAKKKVKGAVILSGGFGEVGEQDLEKQVFDIATKNEIAIIGPNCLGAFNPYSKIDSIFLPMYKLERPNPGDIAFVTQSGAVGSTIIDIAAHFGIGISKFISFGNGTVLNESDFLDFLENDKQTKSIILYLEGAKDGRRLLETMKKVNAKKPIIALKAGKFEASKEAAKSHTGNLAGNYLAYQAAFRQAKVIEADNLEELFDFVKIFAQPLPKGKRIGIITNGGGMGVLTADEIERNNLKLAKFSDQTVQVVKGILPPYGNVGNPLDLIADAGVEAYEKVIEAMMQDPNIDALAIITLFQTPPMDERVLHILTKASDDRRKPICVIAVGGSYTEVFRKVLDQNYVPTYGSPHAAIKALKKLVDYAWFKGKIKPDQI
ncbi:MAG TPA: CoA-binding protein [Candidatus Bilamarchaeaceae archaeon]|nr:CoA-binding protein [Candidatus Bilamarchaeaceae archaeon]